jgi:hypothetical protein
MTEHITLREALTLVDFDQFHDGTWYVSTVKGNCGIVKGNCHAVEGRVLTTINGRQWQYVETPREKMMRLLEEGASKEELLKAMEEL